MKVRYCSVSIRVPFIRSVLIRVPLISGYLLDCPLTSGVPHKRTAESSSRSFLCDRLGWWLFILWLKVSCQLSPSHKRDRAQPPPVPKIVKRHGLLEAHLLFVRGTGGQAPGCPGPPWESQLSHPDGSPGYLHSLTLQKLYKYTLKCTFNCL